MFAAYFFDIATIKVGGKECQKTTNYYLKGATVLEIGLLI